MNVPTARTRDRGLNPLRLLMLACAAVVGAIIMSLYVELLNDAVAKGFQSQRNAVAPVATDQPRHVAATTEGG